MNKVTFTSQGCGGRQFNYIGEIIFEAPTYIVIVPFENEESEITIQRRNIIKIERY